MTSDHPAPKPLPVEQLLTIKDVAAVLNLSTRTVEKEVAEGHLKPIRVRGVRRFRPTDLRRYVAARAA